MCGVVFVTRHRNRRFPRLSDNQRVKTSQKMPPEVTLKNDRMPPNDQIFDGAYSPEQLATYFPPRSPHTESFKYRFAKRVFDYMVCLVFLPVSATLLLALSLFVLCTAGWPVFYRQKRIGRNGRAFTLFKLRTMRVDGALVLVEWFSNYPDALSEWEETRKLRDDPRITRGGRFLRKTSLDELPQLLNVLRGDMSLVGPRPIVEAELARYGDRVGSYLAAIPGLTGLWQVSGRCNVSYEQRVGMDEEYVEQWSLWRDIVILLRTPLSVWRGDGAC